MDSFWSGIIVERSLKRSTDKELNNIFDFIFQNAFGNPIIFPNTPTLVQMKANTWGVVSGDNTKIYIKFGNNTGTVLTGVALT